MLTVIKRSGKEEPFDPEKLKKTIIAADNDSVEPMNESDLKFIMSRVLERLEGREKITSREVYELLVGCMREQKFDFLADAYINFADNHWI